MGREIRMVPPNWSHPQRNQYGHFQPMFNQTFAQAAAEWKAAFAKWESGERPSYCGEDTKNLEYWEWESNPPDRAYYRPWEDSEATWFQVWETVSEGSPVTPAFASKEELVEYLVQRGDDFQSSQYAKPWPRKAAEQFVKSEWAPSMMVQGGEIYTAETGFPK